MLMIQLIMDQFDRRPIYKRTDPRYIRKVLFRWFMQDVAEVMTDVAAALGCAAMLFVIALILAMLAALVCG